MKKYKDILIAILRLLFFIGLVVGSFIELRITHSHSLLRKLSILAFLAAAIFSAEALRLAIADWIEQNKKKSE